MAKVAGYSTVVSYISVKGASDAIAYYKKAFGAEELVRMPMPDGKVGHAGAGQARGRESFRSGCVVPLIHRGPSGET